MPDPDRPVYNATADIDPTLQQATGQMTISFQPDLEIDEVILRLWPNGPRQSSLGVFLSVSDIAVNTAAVADAQVSQPDATTVRIALDAPVAPGTVVGISLSYELRTGGPGRSRVADGAGWMRLGSFLPLLAWEPGVGWATEPPTALFAEAVVSPTADYVVTTTVPDGFDVLATGKPTLNEDGTTTWTGLAVRDFAASVGQFRFDDRVVNAPNPVAVSVGMHESVPENVSAYADRIEASLVDMAERYGAYPWDTLTVAITPDIGGGIEFPTHIMLGNGTIGRTTPHEVGHMFFYSLVGNHQGRDPWLDEGLASWAEFVHEGVDMNFLALDEVSAVSGQPMTFFAGRSDYYDSVYRRPAVGLSRLGTIAEVDCALKIFVAENAFGIATPADLIDAFEKVFGDVTEPFARLGITR